MPTIPDIQYQAVYPGSPQEAFDRFTTGLQNWWIGSYTWSQQGLADIGIEPRVGGFCYEEGPHGFRLHWGRVLEADPGSRLRFLWQIAPDRTPQPNPEQASEVTVIFEPYQQHTQVTLVHSRLDRHGEGAAQYYEGLNSEYGWPLLLAAFIQVDPLEA